MRDGRSMAVAAVAALGMLTATARAQVRVSEATDAVRVDNGQVRLAISADGRSLLSFRHRGQEFVAAPCPLYVVQLVEPGGRTVRVDSAEAVDGRVAVEKADRAVTLTVTGRTPEPSKLTVTLRIRVDGSALTTWRAEVGNKSRLAIRSITCPVVAAPRALGAPARRATGPNLIANPGFESGLEGWDRASPRKGEGDRTVDIQLDRGEARSGKASVRMAFNFSENAQLYCPVQTVNVRPDTPYLLTANFKTELADGAIHLELQDARGWRKLCKMSVRLGGRAGWRRAAVWFRTPADTRAVRIGPRHIGRAGDKKPMKGTVWLDDVSLVQDAECSEFAADDRLVYPVHDGVLIPAPGETLGGAGSGRTAQYPGASMQALAYYDAMAGLYLAAHDDRGNVKRFRAAGGADSLDLSVEHLVPEHPGADAAVGYDTVLGAFHGDWHAAADLYRQWAWKQWWCKTKWHDRPDVHDWAKQWPSMVKLDRYKKETPAASYRALADVTRDFRRLLGRDVVTFFHGWGRNQWQMGAARIKPHEPWGGADVFGKAMADIREAGGRPFVFIMTDYALEAREGKPTPYNDRAAFAAEARPFSKMGFDGKTILRQYRDKHFLARMCPTTDYWRRCLVNKAEQLVRLGVPFVQLDCFPCTLAQPCYNPKHGHEPGYGPWWFEGYRDIAAACRRAGKSVNPEFAMATEEVCELFIPQLDFYMNRVHSPPRGEYDACAARRIPMFTYVYHEYLPPYAGEGAGTTLAAAGKKTSAMDYRGIALSLLWGRLFSVRMLGPYDTYKPDAAILDFYGRAYAAASTYAYDYVVRGRMARPLPMTTPQFDIAYWRWWRKPGSRGVFPSPSVLQAVWRSPTGGTAVLLANITQADAPVTLTLPRARLAATVTRDGARSRTTFATRTAAVKLKAREIVMIEYR